VVGARLCYRTEPMTEMQTGGDDAACIVCVVSGGERKSSMMMKRGVSVCA
jgi:hypothetical protein